MISQIPEPSKWEKSSETEEDTKDEDLREILKAKSSLMFAAPDRNKPKVEVKPEPQKKVESEEEELAEPAPIDVDKVKEIDLNSFCLNEGICGHLSCNY